MTATKAPVPLQLITPRARPAWIALQRALVHVDPMCSRQPDAWFDLETADDAAQACTWCPVQRDCLAYGLAAGETEGIWGGRNLGQRRRSPTTPVAS